MVTLLPRRAKTQWQATRAAHDARRLLESARVSRAYLLGVRPGAGAEPGTRGGLKPGEYATLRASMERVARMEPDERGRFARMAPIRTDGQAHKALQLRIAGMPYHQIAEELGVEEWQAAEWVTKQ